MRSLFLALALASLTACGNFGFPGVYRIDIEQGNIVTQDMIDQLKPGMSQRQVRFILGTPLVEDSFNADRWDYPYLLRNGSDLIRQASVSVHFEGDNLNTVTGDYLPAWAAAPAESETPADNGPT
ncbi:MAG: outer membrane protein assembly factor BamE [Haliea sp.]|jgi:outer membrane protein assembly factor BamE|nr:outer membrane protein assembly factor BamE [Haliea sp.]MDP4789370.1 outer membrane protein assembly factor BamE [Haliea sp.]MDP4917466.1 outer membrane protein assembly factor BamE [Haliea sp.]MDP5063787.1 outer membrane protein assembly factor BamE [Haliea sp.]